VELTNRQKRKHVFVHQRHLLLGDLEPYWQDCLFDWRVLCVTKIQRGRIKLGLLGRDEGRAQPARSAGVDDACSPVRRASLLHSASLLSVDEGGRRIEGGDRTVY